jgi:hypothetical protein
MHSPKRSARLMSDSELAEALDYFEMKRVSREVHELLSLVKPSGAALSHLAAQDLKGYKNVIYRAADDGRTEFFIDLGQLLEGKRRKPNTWSKRDQNIAFILCWNPKIKSTEAVELLKNLGHPAMSPLAFKQLKYNWKRAAAKRRKLWESAGWIYLANSFLDDCKA